MLYEKQQQSERELDVRKVEHRLLQYGAKYKENLQKKSRSYYNDIMKPVPQISHNIQIEQDHNVFDRLFSSSSKAAENDIIKQVIRSNYRVPLDKIIKSNSQLPKSIYQQSTQSIQSKPQSPYQEKKYQESTFSQQQKLKIYRQNFQQSRIQSVSTHSILDLSMKNFKKRQS
ncbi:hypothetical protein pb186bvf_003865 [Paramecium bursaria]